MITFAANYFAVRNLEIEAMFFALGHEARRHIVMLLGQSGGALPSGYLAKRFHHSWPTTTRHLNVLERAGIVVVERRGRSANYRLNRERVQKLLGGWLDKLAAAPEKSTRRRRTSSSRKARSTHQPT